MSPNAADVPPMANFATHARRWTTLSRSVLTRTEELLNRGVTSQREVIAILLDQACITLTYQRMTKMNPLLGRRERTPNVMLLDKQEIIFQINTGATINILPAKFTDEIKSYKGILTMWNKSLIKPLGICKKNIKNPKMHKTYK